MGQPSFTEMANLNIWEKCVDWLVIDVYKWIDIRKTNNLIFLKKIAKTWH